MESEGDINAGGTIRLAPTGPGPARLLLAGDWVLRGRFPAEEEIRNELDSGSHENAIIVDGSGLGSWDSALLVSLSRIRQECDSRGLDARFEGFQEGVEKLLALADAVPERKGARRGRLDVGLLARTGSRILEASSATLRVVHFVGETALGLAAFVGGRARYRPSDLWTLIQETGGNALGIVSLISILVGLILAFIGAAQLKMFGAEIYVANLVGIAMAREMGAMMTAIIMAGRTGAAYAARIGTMQVNEEVDALRTLGISPIEFLVTPRVIAMALMMPLLTLYADFMGILGGGLIATSAFDITATQFIEQTKAAVPVHHFAIGVGKALVYGVIVAMAGCYQGIRCGRSASAVGDATTAAVVQAIVWIVASCAMMTVLCDLLGI